MYEIFKPLGALSIGIGWASLIFLVLNWRGDKTMSFSKHASAHKSAYLTMAIMESIFLPMYLVFIATWFVHTFDLPMIFVVLNAISVAGLLTAAWVPDVADIRGKIHKRVAVPAYTCMIFASPFITFSDNFSDFARGFSVAALIYMAFAGFYLMHEKSRSNFLYIQASFLASIHLTILVATYIR